VMGPDGKLYWSVGDMGANVVDQTGKRWAYPHQGAVMRCNPDGSEFEVFAHGLRNPQELAFDQYGNLISVDNDGDHPGEHERVVHILEGSDTGWRIHWQFGKYNQPGEAYKIWIDERLHVPHFEGQAAYLLPPLALAKDGPAGLAYNPGTALSEDLGGYFFSSHFTASSSNSEIVGIKLEPKGASFSVAEQNSVSRGIVSTGISFGPDGALYLADWMDSYNKKPTGRIWKLHAPENPHPLQAETQQLLAEGMQKRGLPELQTLLGHADMRVRMGAQFELVKRNAAAELENTLATDQPQLARIHAIWGLGQLVRTADHDPTAISELLGDADPEVWAQAAKVLGEIQHTASEPNLLKGLTADFPRVQYFSAEALGKIEAESAFEPLVELLEQIGDSDPHMRHGLMYALSKVADASTIANLASHPSAAVRIGAVVALRHQASAQVSQFLADQQPAVVTEAARAIHDDWGIEAALPALAGALLTSSVQEEAFLRRAINANLRLGDAASAERLATYANQSQAPAKMRAQALRSLGYWQDPPVLDRVEGRYRELTPRDPALALAASLDFFPQWLNATQPEPLVVAAAWSSGRLGSLAQAEQLMGLVKMNRASASVRAAALQALRDMDAPQKVAALELVLTSSDSELRDAAQKMLSGFHLPEKEVVNMLATVLTHGTPKEQQRAFANLGDMDHPEATQILSDWMDKLIAGAVAPAAQLDVLMAAEQNGSPQLAEKITAYEATLPSDDPLAAYRVAMYGGNPKQGGRTAYLNASAQCFRCHQVNGRGGAVGPDLTGIASVLDREQLLESLIEPSARLAPGYGTVVVKLTNGDQRVGTIVTDSDAALTIATAEGGEITLAADQIAEKTIAPSGMPSMKGMLTKAEMRDILAFLGTLTE
ncbi:MAG: HEAT repeat domain-containing protein, partial [Bacteroidota bacterium]